LSVAYSWSGARAWPCIVMLCLVLALDGRAAQLEPESRAIELRITAQPLDEALQEFSRQSGMQVIYFSDLTDGIQSPGVNGKYTVKSALQALLTGSGLSFHVINARTVQIRKEDADAKAHRAEEEQHDVH
jgi:iron complex outermembrane recepter protein